MPDKYGVDDELLEDGNRKVVSRYLDLDAPCIGNIGKAIASKVYEALPCPWVRPLITQRPEIYPRWWP